MPTPISTTSSTRHHCSSVATKTISLTLCMQSLQLNLAKVAFKYFFRDTMDGVSRDLVTFYLEKIDIYLDLRIKDQRNNEQ
eukprot:1690104-Pleurochrysis_carterae.AAC.2